MSLVQNLMLLGLVASPAMAFWRLPCKAPLVVERADPIVNPGSMSGHVHTIMGGNGFDLTMDYNSTQASTCTSCTVHGDFSNYWTPSLWFRHQNGTFESVNQVGGATVYYLQRKGSDSEQLEAFPEGFRMLAGDPFKRSGGTDFPSQAISYNCLDYNLSPGHPETGGFPNYNCPDGLRSQVFFPSCWDGTNLDSADHKSHMSYPIQAYNSGGCPSTHPVHLISIFYEIIWDTNKFANMWYGNEQPFVWSMGDATGYGFHGDFVMGWDRDLLQRAVDTCTNDSGRVEDCAQFTLYPDVTAEQCKKPSKFDEAVTGLLEALPGCNPVTEGPEAASPVKNCASNPAQSSSLVVSSSTSTVQSMVASTLSSSGSHTTASSKAKTSATSLSLSTTSSLYSGGQFFSQSISTSSSLLSSTTKTTSYTSSKHTSSFISYLNSTSTFTTISTSMTATPTSIAINTNQLTTIKPMSSSSSPFVSPSPSASAQTPSSDSDSNPSPSEAICPAGPATITITEIQTSTIYATPTPSTVKAVISDEGFSSSSSSTSTTTTATTSRKSHSTKSSTSTNTQIPSSRPGTGTGGIYPTGTGMGTGYTGAYRRHAVPHGHLRRKGIRRN